MKYKCIIFDCDGVLVDSESISNKVIVDLANKIGANIDLEYSLLNYTGTSLAYVISDIEAKTGSKISNTFIDEYRNKTFQLFKSSLKPIHGIIDLLNQLTVPICVASNGPLKKMEHNLEVTSLKKYFNDNLFSAYEIGYWKPNPTLFLHAAEKMGFTPSDCAVIEDSLSGIKAAKNGGFDVFGFTNSQKEKEAFKNEGAIVFNSMKNLYNLV